MLQDDTIRRLVLETFHDESNTQYISVLRNVGKLAHSRGLIDREHLPREDAVKANEIVWDLIVERIITLGIDSNNEEWPWLRLTEYGKSVIGEAGTALYDHGMYMERLESIVPQLDSVIKQYVIEGLRSFQRGLMFASAVMLGAAAEKAVLLLLESIAEYEKDLTKGLEIEQLLERPRLPTIFSLIRQEIDGLIASNTLPYAVHQGSTEHLLSLFEMIRVHRNEAVHPTVAQVNRNKLILVIQSFPAALELVYRLRGWFLGSEKA